LSNGAVIGAICPSLYCFPGQSRTRKERQLFLSIAIELQMNNSKLHFQKLVAVFLLVVGLIGLVTGSVGILVGYFISPVWDGNFELGWQRLKSIPEFLLLADSVRKKLITDVAWNLLLIVSGILLLRYGRPQIVTGKDKASVPNSTDSNTQG
jgi:hypothetical protein